MDHFCYALYSVGQDVHFSVLFSEADNMKMLIYCISLFSCTVLLQFVIIGRLGSVLRTTLFWAIMQ
jgi:hypothetical protein